MNGPSRPKDISDRGAACGPDARATAVLAGVRCESSGRLPISTMPRRSARDSFLAESAKHNPEGWPFSKSQEHYSMRPSTNTLEFSHAYCITAHGLHGGHARARQGLQGGMLTAELHKTTRLPHGCQGPLLCSAHNTAQAHV